MEKVILENLQALFESRFSAVSLGTLSNDGEMDMAPVGSVSITGDGSITLLKGPLNRSYKNLQANSDAVIMVVSNSLSKWLKYFFGVLKESPGYRIKVKLKEEREISSDNLKPFMKRFGIFSKSKGWQKIEKSLQRLLVFEIQGIREVMLPK